MPLLSSQTRKMSMARQLRTLYINSGSAIQPVNKNQQHYKSIQKYSPSNTQPPSIDNENHLFAILSVGNVATLSIWMYLLSPNSSPGISFAIYRVRVPCQGNASVQSVQPVHHTRPASKTNILPADRAGVQGLSCCKEEFCC